MCNPQLDGNVASTELQSKCRIATVLYRESEPCVSLRVEHRNIDRSCPVSRPEPGPGLSWTREPWFVALLMGSMGTLLKRAARL